MNGAPTRDLVVQGDIVLPDGSVLRSGWLGVTDGLITATSETPLSGTAMVDAVVHLRLGWQSTFPPQH